VTVLQQQRGDFVPSLGIDLSVTQRPVRHGKADILCGDRRAPPDKNDADGEREERIIVEGA
jgi:hypothetical protein